MENPEKYHFDKNRLLALLVKVLLLWREEQQFIVFMTEEKTLNLNMFQRVQRICGRYNLLEPFDQQALQQFVQSIEGQLENLRKMMDILDEAPEEFYCALTDEIMNDPVKLPNSGVIVDRENIEKQLMHAEIDPYDRTPLTKDMLIPCND